MTFTTTPLIDLLFSAPESAVPLVQQAMRYAAQGDWKSASQQMDIAADCDLSGEGEWFKAAGKAADELHRAYYR